MIPHSAAMIIVTNHPPLTLDSIADNIRRVAAFGLFAAGVLLAVFLIFDLLDNGKGGRS